MSDTKVNLKRNKSKLNYGIASCAICGNQADGIHFGAISCRSCNAFFRRAVTLKQKFSCRRFKNCPLKGIRCACRACRYEKCLEIGMNVSLVQPPRDPTADVKNTFLNATETILSQFSNHRDTYSACRYDVVNSPPSYSLLIDSVNRRMSMSSGISSSNSSCASVKISPVLQSSVCWEMGSSAPTLKNSHNETSNVKSVNLTLPLIDFNNKFDRLIFYYCEHMKMMNYCMFSVDDFMQKNQKDKTEAREINFWDIKRLNACEINGFFYWLEKLRPIELINVDDFKLICKNYFVRKTTLDRCFTSSKNPTLVEKGHLTVFGNAFIPAYGVGFNCFSSTENKSTEQIQNDVLRPTIDRLWQSIVIPFTKMQISDAEVVALHLLLLWSRNNNQFVSDKTKAIMEEKRKWTVAQLFDNYERNSVPNPELRLGEILLLLPELELICDLRHQDYQIAKLLKFSNADNCLYDLV